MRILVCGGRDFTDYNFLRKTLEDIINLPFEEAYAQTIIIHGGAKGADSLADKYAINNYIPVENYEADWKKHGKAAGPIRNKQMLDEGKPDLVVAFPGGKGTAHMIKIAKEANIPVKEIVNDNQ